MHQQAFELGKMHLTVPVLGLDAVEKGCHSSVIKPAKVHGPKPHKLELYLTELQDGGL